LNRLREGERLIQGFPAAPIVGYAYYALGDACLLLGKIEESQHLARRAVELLSRWLGARAHALRLLGDIATHPDRFDADRGEAHYLDALALAEPRGMRPLVAHCHLGLGTLYRRTGQREQAREHLATATRMYREMDMRFWLEQAEAEPGA
jgi:tetratricopeptide (TPR) repeat protein